jgi:hypothetical protein
VNLERDVWLDADGMLVRFENDKDTGDKISLLTLLDARCGVNIKISEKQRQESLENLQRMRAIFEQGIIKIDREIELYTHGPLDRIE